MNSTNWKDIAELFGIAAIVASLLFVGIQMKQDQAIATAEGDLAHAANKIERNVAITEHPDIWARGLSGAELAESEAVIFRKLVGITYDVAFFEASRMNRLGVSPIGEIVVADFTAFLFRYPGARRVWLEENAKKNELRSRILGRSDVELWLDQQIREKLALLDQSQD